MISIEQMQRNLLKRAGAQNLLWNFSGSPMLKKYSWFIGWVRKILRLGPEYEFYTPPLPKGLDKIKLRRYKK